MSAADYVLLALVAGYSIWVIFRPKKKKHHCGGDCEHCSGCR